jgi:glutaredoxin-like YruB-family protein
MKKVTIYSTPTCHFCGLAKEYFKTHNISYTEYNVASDLERRKEMIDISGQMGVPVIDIDGQVMVGYEEGQLAALLA